MEQQKTVYKLAYVCVAAVMIRRPKCWPADPHWPFAKFNWQATRTHTHIHTTDSTIHLCNCSQLRNGELVTTTLFTGAERERN